MSTTNLLEQSLHVSNRMAYDYKIENSNGAYVAAVMSPMFLLSSAEGTSRFTSSEATAMSTDRRRREG